MDKPKFIASGAFKDQEFFSVEQVATVLDVTPRTIRNLVNSKKLPAGKVGGKWRIKRDDLEKFVETHYRGEAGVNMMNKELKEFIDGSHMETEGPLQICTIIDMYEEDKDKAEATRDEVWEVINKQEEDSGEFACNWQYMEEDKKSRLVLWGNNPKYISKLLESLDKK